MQITIIPPKVKKREKKRDIRDVMHKQTLNDNTKIGGYRWHELREQAMKSNYKNHEWWNQLSK